MNKVEVNNLDLTLYNEKLENGLSIFIVPKKIMVLFKMNLYLMERMK